MSTTRRLTGWAMAAAGLPLLTVLLVGSRDDLHLSTVLLLFQLHLVATALVGGMGPALTGAAAAFLLANYYFVPPLHTFSISEQDNLVALSAFLVVAGVVSWLVDVTARRAQEAARTSREAETLGLLARVVLQRGEPVPAMLELLCETFALDGAALRSVDERGAAALVVAGAAPPGNTDAATRVIALDEEGTTLLLAGEPDPRRERVLDAFLAQLTTALTAGRLAHQAAEADRLVAVDRLRTALLHAVSHDLRTPLAVLKTSVSSLRQTDVTWQAHDVTEFLATIEEETDRLNALVGNLLDMSRLETGSLRVQLRAVGLDEIVPAVVAHVCAQRPAELDLPESLPSVCADPGLLERVVANLVGNAVQWSPADRAVQIAGVVRDGRVELHVVDHGPGIPAHARPRMFEAFQRMGDRDNTTGVGLGLAVAQGFVQAMGGQLRAEDTAGGGLTMVVALPRAAEGLVA